jgi:cytochrome bd-type quinol oxidase subunit 2
MTLLRNHVALMFFYAVATALFFALLWREQRKERIRLFLIIFCSMFFGGIIFGWVMFPYPLR